MIDDFLIVCLSVVDHRLLILVEQNIKKRLLKCLYQLNLSTYIPVLSLNLSCLNKIYKCLDEFKNAVFSLMKNDDKMQIDFFIKKK